MNKNMITMETFLEWLSKYSTFIYYYRNETTVFLDILGGDAGNVYKNGLQDDSSVFFDKPETVDSWYKRTAVNCKVLKKYGLPEVSFVEFCKNK